MINVWILHTEQPEHRADVVRVGIGKVSKKTSSSAKYMKYWITSEKESETD